MGPLEASKTAQTTEGDQACRQYISAPHQGQVVSSPPAVIRAGLLPKLSSEQLRKTKTQHHTTYQQGRKPAETVWHVVHVSKEQCWRDEQRDLMVNCTRGYLLRETEQESRREDVSTEGDPTEPEPGCPNRVQTSLDPFGETPGPTTKPSNEEPGEHQEMDPN